MKPTESTVLSDKLISLLARDLCRFEPYSREPWLTLSKHVFIPLRPRPTSPATLYVHALVI